MIDSDWRTLVRTRHRVLLAQLNARRSQQRSAVNGSSSLSHTTSNTTVDAASASSATEKTSKTVADRADVLEPTHDEVRQALRELYTACLNQMCDREETYEEQIRMLLTVFQDDIPSELVAEAVGCSCGHARRFEWDSDHGVVREKAWSRKQRQHQASPSMTDKVRSRDNNECVRCGSDDELTVHHIDPVGQGGSARIDNLATLCIQCHQIAHGGNVSSGEVVYDSRRAFWDWIADDN